MLCRSSKNALQLLLSLRVQTAAVHVLQNKLESAGLLSGHRLLLLLLLLLHIG